MKNFIDEYTMDYRNFNDVSGNDETSDSLDVKEVSIVDSRKSKIVLKKLFAVILLSLSVIGVIYQSMKNKGTPVYLSSLSLSNVREYDDFIFPVVMQDPEPFQRIEDANPIVLISSSIWRLVMSKRIDEFDENGLAIVDVEEMWENYDSLFGSSYHPQLPEKIENVFFSFDINENKFHIKPMTNQSCYIPYTEDLFKDGNDTILKVGYVSPNDKWRSLRSERPEKPDPTKYLNYRLSRDDSSNLLYIKSVCNVT